MKSPCDLSRFLQAQERDYALALKEIRNGEKESCWMWYIFPQLRGLGKSPISSYYGLKGKEEALAYWAHPVLGSRLKECCEALLALPKRSAEAIFGHTDALKLRSCLTLFSAITEETLVLRCLERYFHSQGDPKTLTLLKENEKENQL